MIDLEFARKQFKSYLNNYDINNPKIKLKMIHTYEVMNTTDYLCVHENIDSTNHQLALLIALLHDIGRFEQLKRFNSFSDANIDHAKLAVEILFEDNLIRNFIEDNCYDEIIKKAIANHSLYQVEKDSNEQVNLQINLIRDSDKLDNFRVKNIASIPTLFDIDEQQFINQRVSLNILNDVKNHRLIKSSDRNNEVDMWVSYFAFIFDFNFKSSFMFLKEFSYVKTNINRFEYQGKLKDDMDFVLHECLQYIDNNIFDE